MPPQTPRVAEFCERRQRCAIYTRQSRSSQQVLASCDAQRQICEDYAREHHSCGRNQIPSVYGYRNVRDRYYRCRSHASGRAPCFGVPIPAHEIEEFVRQWLEDAEWLAAGATRTDE